MKRPQCETCPYWDSKVYGPGSGYCTVEPPKIKPRFLTIFGKWTDDYPRAEWPLTGCFAGCGRHPAFKAYLASLAPDSAPAKGGENCTL